MTNLRLDKELVKYAKDHGLNISRWINNGLKEFHDLCEQNHIATNTEFRNTWNTTNAAASPEPTQKIEAQLGSVLHVPITDIKQKDR